MAVTAATLLLLPLVLNRANPVIDGYFNELLFDSGGWTLEMHVFGAATLDGYYLRSRSGQAYFKNGIQLGGVYRVITPESLMSPLTIDPLGDSITLHSPQGIRARLFFGSEPASMISAPHNGQSICLRESRYWYYLDNTPTLGQPNDSINARGIIRGYVTDTLGRPVSGVRITYDYDLPDVYSNGSGYYTIAAYARLVHLGFYHPNYPVRYFSQQIWPESTVTLNVILGPTVGVEEENRFVAGSFKIWLNYPNPFNPITMVTYLLPVRSHVDLTVINVQGQEIARLVNEAKDAGTHTAIWNALEEPSGVYFCRIRAGVYRGVVKMLLLR